MTEVKKPVGAESTYTEELAEAICLRIACGESLRSICLDTDMPSKSTVLLWVARDREGFSDQYEAACMARAHHWADELLDIADDGSNDFMDKIGKDGVGVEALNSEHIQRSRLRVDSRKWLLSKMLPKFADKQHHELTGKDGQPIKTENKVEWSILPLATLDQAEDETNPKG